MWPFEPQDQVKSGALLVVAELVLVGKPAKYCSRIKWKAREILRYSNFKSLNNIHGDGERKTCIMKKPSGKEIKT